MWRGIRTETELSSEAEEYLEAIYKLQRWHEVARTTELAGQLNVVPGSVTNTIQHLKEHGLVKHRPYKGVNLTEEGKNLALEILRRHRLAERLLTDVLDLDWWSAHENACKLEHALTDKVISLLEEKLGYPEICPHGNPIPSLDGHVEYEKCDPLAEADLNKPYAVSRVIDEKTKKLFVLASKGITPGVIIKVFERTSKELVLEVEGEERVLDYNIALDVCVKNMEQEGYATEKAVT